MCHKCGLPGTYSHRLDVCACACADRRKALRVHPDKHHGNEQAAEAAAEEFRQLSWANAILSDPDKRRRYDAGSCPCDRCKTCLLSTERGSRKADISSVAGMLPAPLDLASAF